MSNASVAVVIPVFNRAAMLREALNSVRNQTYPVSEIVVVDDGSHDDPASVVSEFPGTRLLRQENLGPSRARNAGLEAVSAPYVLFLDSDDILLPTGIADCVACMRENPSAALVYGGHIPVDEELHQLDRAHFTPMASNAYPELLENNWIQMLGAVLFERTKLLEVGGFDPEVDFAEDYDLFLRLARKYPVACEPAAIAQYRAHNSNRSAAHCRMLKSALAVQKRNRPLPDDVTAMRAYRRGQRTLRLLFASGAWRANTKDSPPGAAEDRIQMFRTAPLASLAAAAWQLTRRKLPPRAADRIRQLLSPLLPLVGKVDFGDFTRTRPISTTFGYDRGTPIDRYYIEGFLRRHSSAIHGRVLEIGSDDYSRQFGTGIAQQDVLNVDPAAADATIVGDLSEKGTLQAAAFDCMIVTQTFHLIYDLQAAIEEAFRGLKPGGTLLATVPGVASVCRKEFRETWYWSLTKESAGRLFGDVFGPAHCEIETFGNVYAATSFLQGLAIEDVRVELLDAVDQSYPMIVAIRAQRPSAD